MKMKPENNNLENNISRLVKLAGDSNQPNKAFTDSLINKAIDELSQPDATRERKSKIMTFKKTFKIFAYAAVMMVGLVVLASLFLPALCKTRESARRLAKLDQERQSALEKSYESQQPQSQVAMEGKERGIANLPASAPIQYQIDGSKLVASDMKVARSLENEKAGRLYMSTEKQSISARRAGDKVLGYSDTLGVRGYGVVQESPYRMACQSPPPPPCKQPTPPMANGGSVPPNGQDADAMFFKNYGVNPFIDTDDDHLSTFAMDVDTASYTLARSYLHRGNMPPNDGVRVEEFVNYFKYNYPAPKRDDFAVYSEASPWQFGTNRNNSYLLRLGLKARPKTSDSYFCDRCLRLNAARGPAGPC
jgi:hypothetical protein